MHIFSSISKLFAPHSPHRLCDSFLGKRVLPIFMAAGLSFSNIYGSSSSAANTPSIIEAMHQVQSAIEVGGTIARSTSVAVPQSLTNAAVPLTFFDGSQKLQACHPSVEAFAEPWNGYKYWIAFTPYPGHDAYYENPNIYASNDQIHWEQPEGLQNPLDPAPDNYKRGVVYNSDTELVFNTDTGALECWWRFVDDNEGIVKLYRRTTTDGVNWTEKECMISSPRKQIDYVSFALVYEDHTYKMWSISRLNTQYAESADGVNWSDPRPIKIIMPEDDLRIWHLDVIHTEEHGYEMVFVAFDKYNDPKRRRMKLYYAFSRDNETFSNAYCLLSPTGILGDWDGGGLYRASLLRDTNGRYTLYYTGISGVTGGRNDQENVGLIFWNDH